MNNTDNLFNASEGRKMQCGWYLGKISSGGRAIANII